MRKRGGSWPRAVPVLMLGLAACVVVGDSSPPAGWETFEQKLDLDLEGSTLAVPLEGMDVFLTEDDDWPETFEIKGDGVSLGGEFPRDARVGYEENWSVLIGTPITIAARHAAAGEETVSAFTVPGVGPVEVLGGTFTIESVDAGWDAKTPLRGRLELRVRGGTGVLTLRGQLSVMGTSWG